MLKYVWIVTGYVPASNGVPEILGAFRTKDAASLAVGKAIRGTQGTYIRKLRKQLKQWKEAKDKHTFAHETDDDTQWQIEIARHEVKGVIKPSITPKRHNPYVY